MCDKMTVFLPLPRPHQTVRIERVRALLHTYYVLNMSLKHIRPKNACVKVHAGGVKVHTATNHEQQSAALQALLELW